MVTLAYFPISFTQILLLAVADCSGVPAQSGNYKFDTSLGTEAGFYFVSASTLHKEFGFRNFDLAVIKRLPELRNVLASLLACTEIIKQSHSFTVWQIFPRTTRFCVFD